MRLVSARRPGAPLACTALAALAEAGCGGTKNANGIPTLKITLTDAACTPTDATAKAGPLTIVVANGGTTRVSELELKTPSGIIVGEKENVVGAVQGSFTLNLRPGRYEIYCPNAAQDHGVLTVTGKATTGGGGDAVEFALATAGYRGYVSQQTGRLVTATRAFVAALRAGDLERARALYGTTRYHYEVIEPVAESFGGLDPRI